jgi:acetolactate synthase I/II/III large subunit
MTMTLEHNVTAAQDMTVLQLLMSMLKHAGVSRVFGIAGGLIQPFFQAVERSPDFSLIVTRHEEGAGFMADGHARCGGSAAVVATTSGPGATNLLTAAAVAQADGVPMIILTGQGPSYALGRGTAQEMAPEDLDIAAIFRPVTKYSAMLSVAERAPHHFGRALRLMLSGRPGPVHLNVPVDLWHRKIPSRWIQETSALPTNQVFCRESVIAAAQLLVEAKRPLFLAGSGCANGATREHLVGLAEQVRALVATTPKAKGLFPEDHPRSLGVVGFATHAAARSAFIEGGADLIFVIGAALNESATFTWDPRFARGADIIQVDIEPDRIGRNYPVKVPLLGDAEGVLLELRHHVRRYVDAGHPVASTWKPEDAPTEATRYDDVKYRTSEEVPVAPQRWRADLREVLPPDALIFSDIGAHMLFNIHHLCVTASQRFFLNLGFGSMGHGVAAPIGAALAFPNRPVIAIVGDACFAMLGLELLTARDYDIPVVWIVENNQMQGFVWHGSRMSGPDGVLNCSVFNKSVDMQALAEGMGVRAFKVRAPGEISSVLPKALALRAPVVIEVEVDAKVCPPVGDRVKTILGSN